MQRLCFSVESSYNKPIGIPVEPNCVLRFSFKASSALYFAMRFSDAKEPRDPNKRMWTEEIELSVCSARDGTFVLDFDNSSSWLASVAVELEYQVFLPPERGLERPLCFLLSTAGGALSSLVRESKNNLILYCGGSNGMSTGDILQSRRRFLAFESRQECTQKTGRQIDFVIDDKFNLAQCVGSTDVHHLLQPLHAWQKPPAPTLGAAPPPSTTLAVPLVLSADVTEGVVVLADGEARRGPLVLQVSSRTLPLIVSSSSSLLSGAGGAYSIAFRTGKSACSPDEVYAEVRAANKLLVHGSLHIGSLVIGKPASLDQLEPLLSACNRLHVQGHIDALCLSSEFTAAWEVALVFHLCRYNGWLAPSAAQHEYHCLARQAETDFLPCLRAHGVSLIAVVRHDAGQQPPQPQQPQQQQHEGQGGGSRYQNVSVLDASLRWLHCHSALRAGDGVLFEAHSKEHVRSVLDLSESAAALPPLVLSAVDKAWLALLPPSRPSEE